MERLSDAIARALGLAMGGDLGAVQQELRALQERERAGRAAASKARHDLGNVLSIAQSSVEAMLDGVAPVTDVRLNRLVEVLRGASELLYAFTADET